MIFRLRNILAMVLTLVVIGSSSLAAVCELACGLPANDCHAAPRVTVSMESHDAMAMGGDCDHEMKGASAPVGTDSVASCSQQGCGHVVATVFEKGGSASSFVTAGQCATTGVARVDGMMASGGVSDVRRPPLLVGRVGPPLVSLRV
jgi:hypothetical protein